jgi:hypothetical protein
MYEAVVEMMHGRREAVKALEPRLQI